MLFAACSTQRSLLDGTGELADDHMRQMTVI